MTTRRAILGALTALGLLAAAPAPAQEVSTAPATGDWPVHQGAEIAADEIVYGHAGPVVYEYLSMTCPHCREFTIDQLPTVEKELIATGRMRLVVRQFPFDARALAAARLVRCGGARKGKGFVRLLLGAQRDWVLAPPEEMTAMLAHYAKMGGLSQEQFDACMTDPALGNAIAEGLKAAAEGWKVRSTPSFVLADGTHHDGAYTAEGLAAFIEGKAAQ